MFPDLIDLGFLHLKTYGACMATGFLLCWMLIEKLSGRKDLSNLLLSLMIGGVLAHRIISAYTGVWSAFWVAVVWIYRHVS